MSEAISRETQIAREAQYHPSSTREEAWHKAEFALRLRSILLNEARRRGFCPEAEATSGQEVHEVEEESLIRQLLDHEISVPDISDDVCLVEYSQHTEAFQTPLLFEAAHILIAADQDSAASSQVLAEQLIERIIKRPALFSDLAREYSACPSGRDGGGLGQLTMREVEPEVARVLAMMEPQTVHPHPVRSSHGYHILKLDRRGERRALPFEAVKEKIRDTLRQRAWVKAARDYVAVLVNADLNAT